MLLGPQELQRIQETFEVGAGEQSQGGQDQENEEGIPSLGQDVRRDESQEGQGEVRQGGEA